MGDTFPELPECSLTPPLDKSFAPEPLPSHFLGNSNAGFGFHQPRHHRDQNKLMSDTNVEICQQKANRLSNGGAIWS